MTRPARSHAAGPLARAEAELRAHALAKPGATEHFPWGVRAIKVRGKVFLFLRGEPGQLLLTTKLPGSGQVALLLPFAEPTGYGLGKAGWVSARFSAEDDPPVDLLCAWIDESYRAVAPAQLLRAASAQAATSERAPGRRSQRPAAPRKPPATALSKPATPAPRKPATPAPRTPLDTSARSRAAAAPQPAAPAPRKPAATRARAPPRSSATRGRRGAARADAG
ncbi:MAG TPA: MmcQ/YjbR family DNA-binding protein [Kofleriaceae bacterium]|nr:MmcQ/YjbR family DNA-binding protein [Kofleriaceae bacterium]